MPQKLGKSAYDYFLGQLYDSKTVEKAFNKIAQTIEGGQEQVDKALGKISIDSDLEKRLVNELNKVVEGLQDELKDKTAKYQVDLFRVLFKLDGKGTQREIDNAFSIFEKKMKAIQSLAKNESLKDILPKLDGASFDKILQAQEEMIEKQEKLNEAQSKGVKGTITKTTNALKKTEESFHNLIEELSKGFGNGVAGGIKEVSKELEKYNEIKEKEKALELAIQKSKQKNVSEPSINNQNIEDIKEMIGYMQRYLDLGGDMAELEKAFGASGRSQIRRFTGKSDLGTFKSEIENAKNSVHSLIEASEQIGNVHGSGTGSGAGTGADNSGSEELRKQNEEIEKLNQALSKQKENLDNVNKQYEESQAEIKKLQDNLDKVTKDGEADKTAISKLTEDLKKAQEEAASYKAKIDEINETVAHLEESLKLSGDADLSKKLAIANNYITQLEGTVNKLQEDLKKTQETVASLTSDLSAVKSEKNTADKQLEDQRKINEAQRQQIENLEKAQEELNEYKSNYESLKETIKETEKEQAKYMSLLNNIDKRFSVANAFNKANEIVKYNEGIDTPDTFVKFDYLEVIKKKMEETGREQEKLIKLAVYYNQYLKNGGTEKIFDKNGKDISDLLISKYEEISMLTNGSNEITEDAIVNIIKKKNEELRILREQKEEQKRLNEEKQREIELLKEKTNLAKQPNSSNTQPAQRKMSREEFVSSMMKSRTNKPQQQSSQQPSDSSVSDVDDSISYSEEAKKLGELKTKIGEVKIALNEKTDAIKAEETQMNTSVNAEIAKLGELESKIRDIKNKLINSIAENGNDVNSIPINKEVKLTPEVSQNFKDQAIEKLKKINIKKEVSLEIDDKKIGYNNFNTIVDNMTKEIIDEFNIVDETIQNKIRELVTTLNGNIPGMSDNNNDLFVKSYEELGKVVIENANILEDKTGVYEEFYNWFKKVDKIKVSETIRNDLGDDWKALTKQFVGKFTKEKGIDVDTLYGEMQAKFPDLLPDPSKLSNATDQLLKIIEVVKIAKSDVDKLVKPDINTDNNFTEGVYTSLLDKVHKARDEFKEGLYLEVVPEINNEEWLDSVNEAIKAIRSRINKLKIDPDTTELVSEVETVINNLSNEIISIKVDIEKSDSKDDKAVGNIEKSVDDLTSSIRRKTEEIVKEENQMTKSAGKEVSAVKTISKEVKNLSELIEKLPNLNIDAENLRNLLNAFDTEDVEISSPIEKISEEWEVAFKAAKQYNAELSDAVDIVKQLRTVEDKKNKTKKRLISYKVTDNNGKSITVGQNGDLISSTDKISTAATDAKRTEREHEQELRRLERERESQARRKNTKDVNESYKLSEKWLKEIWSLEEKIANARETNSKTQSTDIVYWQERINKLNELINAEKEIRTLNGLTNQSKDDDYKELETVLKSEHQAKRNAYNDSLKERIDLLHEEALLENDVYDKKKQEESDKIANKKQSDFVARMKKDLQQAKDKNTYGDYTEVEKLLGKVEADTETYAKIRGLDQAIIDVEATVKRAIHDLEQDHKAKLGGLNQEIKDEETAAKREQKEAERFDKDREREAKETLAYENKELDNVQKSKYAKFEEEQNEAKKKSYIELDAIVTEYAELREKVARNGVDATDEEIQKVEELEQRINAFTKRISNTDLFDKKLDSKIVEKLDKSDKSVENIKKKQQEENQKQERDKINSLSKDQINAYQEIYDRKVEIANLDIFDNAHEIRRLEIEIAARQKLIGERQKELNLLENASDKEKKRNAFLEIQKKAQEEINRIVAGNEDKDYQDFKKNAKIQEQNQLYAQLEATVVEYGKLQVEIACRTTAATDKEIAKLEELENKINSISKKLSDDRLFSPTKEKGIANKLLSYEEEANKAKDKATKNQEKTDKEKKRKENDLLKEEASKRKSDKEANRIHAANNLLEKQRSTFESIYNIQEEISRLEVSNATGVEKWQNDRKLVTLKETKKNLQHEYNQNKKQLSQYDDLIAKKKVSIDLDKEQTKIAKDTNKRIKDNYAKEQKQAYEELNLVINEYAELKLQNIKDEAGGSVSDLEKEKELLEKINKLRQDINNRKLHDESKDKSVNNRLSKIDSNVEKEIKAAINKEEKSLEKEVAKAEKEKENAAEKARKKAESNAKKAEKENETVEAKWLRLLDDDKQEVNKKNLEQVTKIYKEQIVLLSSIKTLQDKINSGELNESDQENANALLLNLKEQLLENQKKYNLELDKGYETTRNTQAILDAIHNNIMGVFFDGEDLNFDDISLDNVLDFNGIKDDVNNIISALNTTESEMKDLEYLGSTDIFKQTFKEASLEIQELNNKLISGEIELKEYNTEFKKLKSKLNSRKDTIAFFEQGNMEQAIHRMKEYASVVSGGKYDIVSLNKELGVMTIKFKDANGQIQKITMSTNKANNAINRTFGKPKESLSGFDEFLNSLKGKFLDLARYLMTFVGFHEFFNMIRNGINYLVEFDTAMTELIKVSNDSERALRAFGDEAFRIADQVASTGTEITQAAADWSRLGYSIKEASELAKNSAIYVNVGDGIDVETATSDMVSAMKAFDIEAEDSISIIDRYNAVANQYAISAGGIGAAMARSSSALAMANNSIDQSVAMAAAMNEIIQDEELVGQTLKTLSLRLRGAKTEIEDAGESTDGMAESTSKLREQVLALTNVAGKGGFDIMLNDDEFKSTYDIVKGIAETWEDISDVNQAALLELLAGKNRAQGMAALLTNFAQAENALKTSLESEGSALRENEKYMDSIQGKIKEVKNSWQELWTKGIDDDLVKGILDLAKGLLDVANNAGLVKTAMAGLGAVIGTVIGYKTTKSGGRARNFVVISKLITCRSLINIIIN